MKSYAEVISEILATQQGAELDDNDLNTLKTELGLSSEEGLWDMKAPRFKIFQIEYVNHGQNALGQCFYTFDNKPLCVAIKRSYNAEYFYFVCPELVKHAKKYFFDLIEESGQGVKLCMCDFLHEIFYSVKF